MRGAWGVLFLTASLVAAAPLRVVDVPPISGRYEIPTLHAEKYSFPVNTTFREVLDAVRSKKLTERKIAAVRVLLPKEGDRPAPRELEAVVEAIESFRREKSSSPFRRYAIATLIGPYASHVREWAVRRGTEPFPAWEALQDIRGKLSQDPDLKLREFMERFESLGPPVPWQAMKTRSLALGDKALRARPTLKRQLADALETAETIESKLLARTERLTGKIDLALPPETRERLAAQIREDGEHRLYTTWGTLYRKSLIDKLNASEAMKIGAKVEPVRLGWPR